MKWLDDKIDKRSERLFIFLSLAAYVVVQSFAVHAPLFPADDLQELSFVNGMSSWTELLGRDFFGLFRPVKNVIFHVLSCFDPEKILTQFAHQPFNAFLSKPYTLTELQEVMGSLHG